MTRSVTSVFWPTRCHDELVERWLSWGTIERQLGFRLPFLAVGGLPEPERIPFVRALQQKARAAIQVAAPKDIGREWGAAGGFLRPGCEDQCQCK